MKLPFKYIATLVVVSLLGIFAYQAYWLTGLYHTMHDDMVRGINEAMRMSDYNEMMMRIDKMQQENVRHGYVDVSAGYDGEGKSYVRSSTTVDYADSLEHSDLQKKLMSKADSVSVSYPNDSTRVEVSIQKDAPMLSKEDSILFIDNRKGKKERNG